ncbi:MAG: hypothetical protein ACR2QW_08795 [bacterium]
MATIKKLRESIETRLECCDAIARVIESQVDSDRLEARARIEYQKKKMSAAAARMAHIIKTFSNISSDRMQVIEEKISKLQLALASDHSDDPYSFRQEKSIILDLIGDVETLITRFENEQAREWEATVREWVNEEVSLEAELDYSQLQYPKSDIKQQRGRGHVKREIQDQLNTYRENLIAKRRVTSEKLESFGTQIESDLDSIKQSFSKLFSGRNGDRSEESQTNH